METKGEDLKRKKFSVSLDIKEIKEMQDCFDFESNVCTTDSGVNFISYIITLLKQIYDSFPFSGNLDDSSLSDLVNNIIFNEIFLDSLTNEKLIEGEIEKKIIRFKEEIPDIKFQVIKKLELLLQERIDLYVNVLENFKKNKEEHLQKIKLNLRARSDVRERFEKNLKKTNKKKQANK